MELNHVLVFFQTRDTFTAPQWNACELSQTGNFIHNVEDDFAKEKNRRESCFENVSSFSKTLLKMRNFILSF